MHLEFTRNDNNLRLYRLVKVNKKSYNYQNLLSFTASLKLGVTKNYRLSF